MIRLSGLLAKSFAATASIMIVWCLAAPCALCQDDTGSRERGARGSKTRNVVGLFLGATTKFKEHTADETSITVAGEYEYLPSRWGVGGVIELIYADELEGILIPVVYYHPQEVWLVRSGVGLEIAREEDAETTSAHLLWRVGVGYDIPVGKAILVPSIDLDLVRSDVAIAYGFVIAKEF